MEREEGEEMHNERDVDQAEHNASAREATTAETGLHAGHHSLGRGRSQLISAETPRRQWEAQTSIAIDGTGHGVATRPGTERSQ